MSLRRNRVIYRSPSSDIEHINLSDVSSADEGYLSADAEGDILMREHHGVFAVKQEPQTPTMHQTLLGSNGHSTTTTLAAAAPVITAASSANLVAFSSAIASLPVPAPLKAPALGLSLRPVVTNVPVVLTPNPAPVSSRSQTNLTQPAVVKEESQAGRPTRVLPPRSGKAGRKPVLTIPKDAPHAPTIDSDEMSLKIKALTDHVARLELQLKEQTKVLRKPSLKQGPRDHPIDSDDSDSDLEGDGKRRPGRRDPQRVVLTRCIRQHVRDVLEVCSSLPKEDWVLPPADVVELFNSGMATMDGPGRDMLAGDWNITGRTPWTKRLATYMAQDFEMERQHGKFPPTLGTPSQSSVLSAFLGHITYLKQLYKREVEIVDEEEVERRAAVQREQGQKSRSDSRKRQIIDRRSALLRHHGYPTEAQDTLEKIGVHGMSSEESDGEVGEKKYWVKVHKWRSPALTVWLQGIDDLALVNASGKALPRRQYHRTRHLSHKQSTNKHVPKGLPRSHYSQDWLAKDGARMRLRMPEQGDVPHL